VVEVADTGTGIPDSVLPRIFDLYFTTKSTGSGIGLAMTYRIMQLHGGALDVRSNTEPDSPDRGTVFTVRIPVSVQGGSEVRKPAAKLADTVEPALISTPAEIAANIGTKESR
jgi:nitrogen-specific signal transduction histidine kinase